MGIYSDVLRRRENNDNQLQQAADNMLLNHQFMPSGPERLEEVRAAIGEILRQMNISAQDVRNCSTTEELLEAMLDPENILYEKISLKDNIWRKRANLVLACAKNGAPLVLSPSLTGYMSTDPISGRKTHIVRNADLQDEGYAIFRPLEGDTFSVRNFLSLMVHLILPWDIPLIALASLLVALLGLVAPRVNRDVLTQVVEIGEGAIPFLLTSCTVFVLAGLTRGAISVIKTLLLGRMKQRISAQMQAAIMSRLLLMPYPFFVKGNTGKLSYQVRNSGRLADLMIQFVLNNILTFVFSLVYIPQIKRMTPVLLVPALIILGVQMFLSVVLTFSSAQHTARKIRLQQDADNFLFEALKGMQKIQNIGAGKRVYARIAQRQSRVLSVELTPPWYILLSDIITTFIASLGTMLTLILAAAWQVPRADYIAFTASYTLVAGSVTALVGMCNNIVNMRPLIAQLTDLFRYAYRETGREYVRKLDGEIELNDLSFSYEQGARGCVDHISLHIRPGEKVAFVGESGCGKSTLLMLLLGMLTPDSGTILYDGKPLPTLNKRSLRKRIASVFQFTRLFPGTIMDNICFGSPNATEQDAWAAAEAAAIAEEIRILPLGMETEISEGNGGGFSGGQTQRLKLARAFAQKPSVLFLDEATSALDNLSQHRVLDSISHMNCTVLMVAHRLSTVIDCDRIVALKDGRIAEEGTYQELMEMNGYFAELVKKQQV